MFWRKKKILNIVPDDYEFSESYTITIAYNKDRYDGLDWEASAEGFIYLARGKTKEEATIKGQNALYRHDLEEKKKAANPPETFVIPPIRKFSGNE